MEPFVPVNYMKRYEPELLAFLEKCLPESGRALDLNGRHQFYLDIAHSFRAFWCMFDGDAVIGTVALRESNTQDCELKSLYLLEKYHGNGYGRKLLETAMFYARSAGYEKMYLDSLSTSRKALALYRRAGFIDTERYNDSVRSDVFMVLNLKGNE